MQRTVPLRRIFFHGLGGYIFVRDIKMGEVGQSKVTSFSKSGNSWRTEIVAILLSLLRSLMVVMVQAVISIPTMRILMISPNFPCPEEIASGVSARKTLIMTVTPYKHS